MIHVFSSRLNWDLTPNPLSLLVNQKRAAGIPILDLTISNPTVAGFNYPPIAFPPATQYDPHPRGLLTARETILPTAPDKVLLTASTSEAYAYLFKLLCNPGDEILTPRPSYPLFEFLAALESVNVRQYPLRYDGAWHIDFAALEAAITNRTRAVVVVNPNNPTGSYLKPDESERLQSICAARDIAILIDEVFFEYDFNGAPALPPPQALTFRMSGLSKLCGLPQMKLGWMIAEGPGHQSALDRLELIADTFLSVSTPVQQALPQLLAAGETVRTQIRERTRQNLSAIPHAMHVEGGWSAILQVPNVRSEESWATTLLSDHNVLIQPGYFFDFESEAFLILSLLTPPDTFARGLESIKEIG